MIDLFEEKAIKPMLIKDMMNPFNSNDWIYELKLDGIRCIAYLDDFETDLRNKRNMKLLPRFPELQLINNQIKNKCILDGELIVLKNGVPDFYELQRRTLLTDTFKIQLENNKYPASFVAYDIIYYNNKTITDLSLIERKKILQDVLVENKDIAISRFIQEKGIELFNIADQNQLEGVVAKRKDSKYYFDKRTNDWVKFKRMADEDFVICGYNKEKNTLTLGQFKGDVLIYKGNVSFGVKQDFLRIYNCKITNDSPFNLTPSSNDDVTWLEPTLVCVVEYMPNTKDSLRQPVFKAIRDDVIPKECQVKP
ncbi:ATP-dependent DNA ligase [[Clostridium] fimetarium]|uniref:DNA ligase (ATP) n=1 Tax=[Clostridium] fimetarium TaxID=99656 RepID=A0A1I0PZD6_9FIRM|nr:RNA ligase family protein [[Clostridium] fimetarium]SEW20067.1 bifunctional non-homologous end joining protein LigD [[Clostridium] fimetarium]